MHRERHSETRCQQDDRVECADLPVQRVAGSGEGRVVPGTIDQVRHEHAAEKHELLHQEEPHAETRRSLLLLHRLEMVEQVGRMFVVRVLDLRLDGVRCRVMR